MAGPDGVDLASAGSGDELLLAEIDAALHAAPRADNTHLGDRRPELYASLVDGAPATREETSR